MHATEEIRGGLVLCMGRTKIATWNVEGLTDSKVEELQIIMEERGIGILCLQETHRAGADYFFTEKGYLLILSGGPVGQREWAGVGFIIASFFRRSIIGFQ